jgi:hypothetical protein
VWIALTLAILVIVVIWLRSSAARIDKQKAQGVYAERFVYVEDDGTARELAAGEADCLNTSFHPTDGARPYIKARYKQLSPDGKIGGFLLRRKLPSKIQIRPLPFSN